MTKMLKYRTKVLSLQKFSTLFMSNLNGHGEDYFQFNHIKHLKSWYGFVIKPYYSYLAKYCMSKPAKIATGSKVLDIGCGIGLLVEAFNKLGFYALGVDISDPAIANSIAKEKCFLVKSTSKLGFAENVFDLVVSREVLEHIPEGEIDECISEWDRISKGIMIHLIAVSERGESAFADPNHVNVKPERWWVEKFRDHGYIAAVKLPKYFFSLYGRSGYFIFKKNKFSIC